MLTTVNLNHCNNVINNSSRKHKAGARVNFGSNNNVYAPFERFITQKSKTNNITTTQFNSLDPEKDGKFSWKVAIKNYFKGVVSPVTSMFKSVKNFALGSIVIATTTAMCYLGMAPLVVAAGITVGLLQAGKAIYKMIKAKNGDQVERACFDAGAATTSLGLSAIGAKASLRSIGIDTKNMSFFTAILENYKHAIPSITRGTLALKFKFVKMDGKEAAAAAHKARIHKASKLDLLDAKKLDPSIKNPYQVLGIKNKASVPKAKAAYRKLASEFHPDKKPGAEAYFKEVNEAYTRLSDPAQKAAVDNTITADQILKAPLALIPNSINKSSRQSLSKK